MKLSIAFAALMLFSLPTFARNHALPPYANDLSGPQTVDVLAYSNSNQVQYLGFDWINSYCFGKVLGCVVTDHPATAQYSYGEIVFGVGDWLIYATCFGDGPDEQYKILQPCWQPDSQVQISPKENRRTLLVGRPGEKWRRGTGHTYTAVSAFNTKTKDVWGNGTLDSWRMVVAAIEIAKEIKKMNIDDQLVWSGKIVGLRTMGLMTPDNLEQVLVEIQNQELVSK